MADSENKENLSKKVTGKLGLLTLIEEEARVALNTKDRKGIERHIKIYESKIEEVFELKTKLQELKLEEGEELDEIKAWSSQINNEIQKFNPIIEELQQFVKEIKSSERKEEERELLLSKQRQHEKETELEKASASIRTCLVLYPILGVGNMLFLFWEVAPIPLAWTSVICNSFLAMIFFILHIALDSQVLDAVFKMFGFKQSNTTHSSITSRNARSLTTMETGSKHDRKIERKVDQAGRQQTQL